MTSLTQNEITRVYIVWETFYSDFSSVRDSKIIRVMLNEKEAEEYCSKSNDSPTVLGGVFQYWYEGWEAV